MRLALSIFLVLCSTFTWAEAMSLRGVWRIASTHYDDEAIPILQPPQIKVFTERHLFYTYYNRGLEEQSPHLSVGHGTYSVTDHTLTETIENHSNPELIGQTFEVTISVEPKGNSFTQIVDLGKYVLRERWVRLE